MKQITKYVAFDGAEFDSEHAARDHETKNAWKRLTPLHEDICRVLKIYDLPVEDRPEADVELATVLEAVGVTLQRARIAKREVKRERKAKADIRSPLRSLSESANDLHAVGAITDDERQEFQSIVGRDLVAEAKAEMDARVAARDPHDAPQISVNPEDRRDPEASITEDYSEEVAAE